MPIRWRLLLGAVAAIVILAGLGVFFFRGALWPSRGPETTLARIKRQGVLRYGADPSGGAPFAFDNPLNPAETTGFETELVERLAKHMGVRAVLVRGDWNSLIPSLEADRVDLVLNGLEVNDKRAEVIRFSTPYFQYAQQLTIRAADKDRYRSLEDLRGKPIAVLNGSASIDVLMEKGWAEPHIIQFDDSLKPYEAVRQGRAEAAMGESIIANYYAGQDRTLHNLPELFSPGVYAAAVRKEDEDLLAEVDRILNQMKESGELGELYQRWGIWSDRQEELGIKKGNPQEEIALARPVQRIDRVTFGRIAGEFLFGAGCTLLLTALGMPLALAFGLVLALLGRSPRVWLRWPAMAYIQVIRGTPLLVQILFIFFTLPWLGKLLANVTGIELAWLLVWPAFAVGLLCLAANYAAYEAEIHRAGLEAVPKGQREAALSLGMSESQAFLFIILPQSFRIILPPVVNDLVSMLKDSCLVSAIGVSELLYVAGNFGKATFLYGQFLLAASVVYLILSVAADRLGKYLENRLKRQGAVPMRAGHVSH